MTTIEFEKIQVEVIIRKEIDTDEEDKKRITRTIDSVLSDGNDCGTPGFMGHHDSSRYWNVYGNDEGHLMISIVEDTDW